MEVCLPDEFLVAQASSLVPLCASCDPDFLQVANGIHNIHYARKLAHTLVQRLPSVCRELGIDQPTVKLPETPKGFK